MAQDKLEAASSVLNSDGGIPKERNQHNGGLKANKGRPRNGIASPTKTRWERNESPASSLRMVRRRYENGAQTDAMRMVRRRYDTANNL